MEAFVDKIIETDRKAREIIEAAQQQKIVLQKQAVKDAHAELAQRATLDQQAMAQQNEKMEQREAVAIEQADKDYMGEKHKLDETFGAGMDGWLSEITKACITVK